jgi:hypothetical protein
MSVEILIGPNGKIPIVMRDDDTNFFTSRNMLETVYSESWSKGFKISLSVVPFQRGINDVLVPPSMRQSGEYYSISNNRDLVGYLQDKISAGQMEILQHGLSHDYSDRIHGEFGGESDRKNDIVRGKDILNQTFGIEPKFFVPPGEDINRKNLQGLKEASLVPICRRTLFDRFVGGNFIPNCAKEAALKLYRRRYAHTGIRNENFGFQMLRPAFLHLGEGDMIIWSIPKLISFKKIASADSLVKSAKRIIDNSFKKRYPIIIINHYHIYFYDWSSSITRTNLYDAWSGIVESLNSLSSGWKIHLSELYERLRKVKEVQVARSGSKITISSGVYIENLCIRTRSTFEPNKITTEDKEDPSIKTIEELRPQDKVTLYVKKD